MSKTIPYFQWRAQYAAQIIAAGGVLAYPTEAVWGLGCDPFNQNAVQRILTIKGRDMSKGLILIGSKPAHFGRLLRSLPPDQQACLTRSQASDRAITWLVEDEQQLVPCWVKGQHTSVAIRLTAHPICAALCEAFGGALVSTSANPAGMPSALNRLKVQRYFADRLDYVLSGSLGCAARASQIIDLKTREILRA
jgi:L-threonylcarbamoyladenylate synthase